MNDDDSSGSVSSGEWLLNFDWRRGAEEDEDDANNDDDDRGVGDDEEDEDDASDDDDEGGDGNDEEDEDDDLDNRRGFLVRRVPRDDEEYFPPNVPRRRLEGVMMYGYRDGQRQSPRLRRAALSSWEMRRNHFDNTLQVGDIIQYNPQTVGRVPATASHVIVRAIRYTRVNCEPDIVTHPLAVLVHVLDDHSDGFAFRIANEDGSYGNWRSSVGVNLRSGDQPVESIPQATLNRLHTLNANERPGFAMGGVAGVALLNAIGRVHNNLRNEGREGESEASEES